MRLEDIASTVEGGSSTQINGAFAAVAGLGAGGGIGALAAAAPAPASPPEPLPRSVEEFDKLIEDVVVPFVTASGKIGGLVEEQVLLGSYNKREFTDTTSRPKPFSKHSKQRERSS